ncbi:MAG: hypothetical protein A2Z91_07220 [Deltaproteobacteria bacterium GWA2_38_16]|nr:MAG: hypothetical protein A2Z91_07220 [Deltaproteobacteria bacterium GWA2_38_16]OGQ02700.1 MAG: hypothetical protein A3D19_00555 [Deltaproteobacteria bacterium RIFCSPHIGHO2_02_FULL_38_15]OGQ34059.1 MAG: hypothetical protein A3A72_00930 [Deltaproteobacteria bacterium RIFCSPLOWO2_01_FULL_38_9]OGQ59044.1 MAG: hypothetical protein A3G92_05085 [Deltaproteobacteria bacterium RIFCSPLOWO2_12_FULL_38_8]HBQ20557.1 hypothetical protein [Deltaproteobacteria bacterium]
MAKKIFIAVISLLLFSHCSSIKVGKVEKEKALSGTSSPSYEELWQAAYQVSLKYPLRDFSKEEGAIESDWITEGEFTRYRFFISIDSESTPIGFDIDVQSQRRKTSTFRWQWVEPSLDKSENLKNSIHEHLKKIRAT